jgi:transcriptional regulator with XRE-family HTH domain
MTTQDRRQRIARILAGAPYSRQEIAAACKTTPQAVSQWAAGKTAPGNSTLALLAAFLGLDPWYLKSGEKLPPDFFGPMAADPRAQAAHNARAAELEAAAARAARAAAIASIPPIDTALYRYSARPIDYGND